MSPRVILIVGAVMAAAAVALGAFGAHGMETRLEQLGHTATVAKRIAWFDTGVRYHMYHALALVAVATAASARMAAGWQQAAAIAFVLGVVLFSGSLYAMTLGPDSWKRLGLMTPLGGLAFLIGWTCVAIAAWRGT